MFNKPHYVNFINSLILILASNYSYFSNTQRPMTALIGAFLGLVLIGLTNFIIQGNRHVAHLIVLVTLIFSITTGVMGYKSSNNPELDEETKSRRVTVFAIMSASCLAATGYYIMGFIERKKNMKLEEAQNQE